MSTTKARTAVVAKELKDGEKAIQHSTVINPYALAELVAGRRISWREIDDAPRLLESLLETPYEQLFDPVYDSPLYLGFRLNAKLELEHVDVELPEVREDAGNDLESPNGVGTIARLADLGPLFETDDIGKIAVDRADLRTNALDLTIRLSDPLRKARLARVLPRDLLDLVVYRPKRVVSDGFNPPNTAWTDNGDFFEETTEFFDPIQGAVANCYLIAAMASVAWARPYLISHLTRATGQAQQQFTDMIRFYDIDHGNAEYDVEVTEATIVSSASGAPVYCRSSEPGEIWPAVYEKAFAKWKTGIAGDRPDITATAWGDCVRASAELTGLARHYYDTASRTADELWNIVRANSLSGRRSTR